MQVLLTRIILDTENDDLLKGKTVHALSCQSAKKLGPDAMKKGAKAYIGYKQDFIAFLDDSTCGRHHRK